MARTCTICSHPDRAVIDSMIANRDPYLRIATTYGLNDKTVGTHAKTCVHPLIDSIELQANAAVLKRVMAYRDEVNLPLPEKAKYIENKLWADYYDAETISERMLVHREIQKQQVEQAKLIGAYTLPKENPVNMDSWCEAKLREYIERGIPEEVARGIVQRVSGIEPGSDLVQ